MADNSSEFTIETCPGSKIRAVRRTVISTLPLRSIEWMDMANPNVIPCNSPLSYGDLEYEAIWSFRLEYQQSLNIDKSSRRMWLTIQFRDTQVMIENNVWETHLTTRCGLMDLSSPQALETTMRTHCFRFAAYFPLASKPWPKRVSQGLRGY